jgi:hypothetical protein
MATKPSSKAAHAPMNWLRRTITMAKHGRRITEAVTQLPNMTPSGALH